jgi:hypothetical protein
MSSGTTHEDELRPPARGWKIPVYLNHDPTLRIGNLRSLTPNRSWWVCDFEVDEDLGVDFEVGQNVSVGLEWFNDDTNFPRMGELSVVRHGRVPGAEITSRVPWNRDAKPVDQNPKIPAPAVRATSDRPPAGARDTNAVVYRQSAVSARHAAEDAEVRRVSTGTSKRTAGQPTSRPCSCASRRRTARGSPGAGCT